MTLKRQLLRFVATPPVAATFAPLTIGGATIFMLHRFRHPERDVHGDDPRTLSTALAYLRRNGYELLSVMEVFDRLRAGNPLLRKAVAFTIDDGYADHAEIAAPVFAEFDCPVTTFVTTGFLDEQLWFWWDRIEYAFHHANRPAFQIEVGGEVVAAQWQDETERQRKQAEFIERCKLLADAEKHASIDRLAEALDTELPERAPLRYAPMSWEQLRSCERAGMTFGPHTVTHPILSRATDPQSEHEIEESWRRLREQATAPVPVFCYPNGQTGDFGPREIDTLRRMGLAGAVVGYPGHATVNEFQANPSAPFMVRRIACPDDLPTFVQYVSGFEHLKQRLRPARV
jgi:peptidoglycan/xylan/chitin deacetylase (PgdA/CDA1 family)